MAIKKLYPDSINTSTATAGDVLVYSAANGVVEFGTVETSADNNAWVNANDFSTYTTISSLIDLVQANVSSLPDSAANDYSTYSTVTGLIDLVQANVSSLPDSAANDYSTYSTVTGLIDLVQANVSSLPDSAANDYSTYSTVTSLIDLVQANVSSLPDSAANDYSTYTTLSGLINTINENVTSGVSSAANDYTTYTTLTSNTYNTYTTLSGLINTVQDNVASSSSADVISDQFTISSTNTFTLTQSVIGANNIIVSYNGLIQNPNDDYIVSGTTLSMNNTVPLYVGAELEVRHLATGGTGAATSYDGKTFVMSMIFGG
jgi:DICT domain-containing protein